MREDDLEEFMCLFASVADEGKWIGTEPGFDREQRFENWRARLLAPETGTSFVATSGGRIVGNIATYPHEEYGWMIGMVVDAEYRGRGIGSRLMEAAIDWARRRGLPEIGLLVFAHNRTAIALYQKYGFETREYWERDVTRQTGEIFDTILMVKRLAS